MSIYNHHDDDLQESEEILECEPRPHRLVALGSDMYYAIKDAIISEDKNIIDGGSILSSDIRTEFLRIITRIERGI